MKTKNNQKREYVQQVSLPLSPIEELINQLCKAHNRDSWDWEHIESVVGKTDELLCSYDFQVMEYTFQSLTSECRVNESELCVAEVMLVRLYIHRICSASQNLKPLSCSFFQWLDILLSFGYLLLMSYRPANPESCRHNLQHLVNQKVGDFWQTVFFQHLWGEDSLMDGAEIKGRCCRLYAGPLFDQTFDCVSGYENQQWVSLRADIAKLSQVFTGLEVSQIDVSAERLRAALLRIVFECCEQLITNIEKED